MDAAISFYRRLGIDLDLSTDHWPPGNGARHVHAHPQNAAADFDLDNQTMARLWRHDALQAADVVLGFAFPSGEAVDEKSGQLVAAGYPGRREPYDTFFGARDAMLDDPDGRPVGLMAPLFRGEATHLRRRRKTCPASTAQEVAEPDSRRLLPLVGRPETNGDRSQLSCLS